MSRYKNDPVLVSSNEDASTRSLPTDEVPQTGMISENAFIVARVWKVVSSVVPFVGIQILPCVAADHLV